jgi:hypothetical protein
MAHQQQSRVVFAAQSPALADSKPGVADATPALDTGSLAAANAGPAVVDASSPRSVGAAWDLRWLDA